MQTIQRQKVVETHRTSQNESGKRVIFRAYLIIWYILGLVETLLVFRFFLRLFAANPRSSFVAFIYSITDGLVGPFVGIFRNYFTDAGAVVDWAAVMAIVVYFVVAYGIIYLFQLVKPADSAEVEQTIDKV